jgi:hypothetical protein
MSMILKVRNRIAAVFALSLATATVGGGTPPNAPMTETPVWYMSYTHTVPGKMDQYLEQVRLLLVPVLEEDKRQGGILDYKVLRKLDGHGADDWNIELIVIFKNHAKMDGYQARWEAIGKKINGNREEVDRNQMRIDVGADLLEEIHF